MAILALILLSSTASAGPVSFAYSDIEVKETEFNVFQATFTSPSGYTAAQINNAIEISGEKSKNIIITSVTKEGTAYKITGSLKDYSIKYNKLFNPWFNTSYLNVTFLNLTNGYRPAVLTVNLTNSTGQNNGTHVYLGDNVNNGTDGVIAVLNNATLLNTFLNLSRNELYINVTGNGSVQLYYNTSLITSRNGTITFPVFDEFNGSSLNTSVWTKAGAGTATVSGGAIVLNGDIEIGANINVTNVPDYPQVMELVITQGEDLQFISFSAVNPISNCITPVCNANNNIGAGAYDGFRWSRTAAYSEIAYTFGDGIYKLDIIPAQRYTITQNGALATKTDNIPNAPMHPAFDDYRALGGPLTVYNVQSYLKIIDGATWSAPLMRINITDWNNTISNNRTLNLTKTGTNESVTFTNYLVGTPINHTWRINGTDLNINSSSLTHEFNVTNFYYINFTVNDTLGYADTKNWTVNYTQVNATPAPIIIPTPISNCGLNMIVNNTNLALTIHPEHPGTGERLLNTTYYANRSAIQLMVFAHADAVSDVAGVFMYINGTLVAPQSGRPLGAAEQAYRGVVITVPRYAYYNVSITNYHHYEWREYAITLDISGCLYPDNNDSLNNVIEGISVGLSVAGALIAIVLCRKKRRKEDHEERNYR